jgi:hypothetical protein
MIVGHAACLKLHPRGDCTGRPLSSRVHTRCTCSHDAGGSPQPLFAGGNLLRVKSAPPLRRRAPVLTCCFAYPFAGTSDRRCAAIRRRSRALVSRLSRNVPHTTLRAPAVFKPRLPAPGAAPGPGEHNREANYGALAGCGRRTCIVGLQLVRLAGSVAGSW